MCNEDGEWSPRVITDCLGMLHKLRISYKFSVCSIISVSVLFFYNCHTSYITIFFISDGVVTPVVRFTVHVTSANCDTESKIYYASLVL